MAYEGVLKDIKKCIEFGIPERIPIFALSEEFDVRIAGMTYAEYCQDSEKIFACQKKAIEKFDYDWCWLQIDDCIEFEILGVGCKGEGNILRATCNYLPASSNALNRLEIPDFAGAGRGPVLLEAIKKCKDHFGDTVCVVGRTAAPLSSATLLYGINETLMMLVENQDLLNKTLEFFTELQIAFGVAQINAGADAIWFGDCCASSAFISPADYRVFALPYAKRVAEAYRKHGAWTFYHASEYNPKYLELMSELGVSVISAGENADIKVAKEKLQGKTCLMGNLDPIKVLMRGSAKEVAEETLRILESAATGGGYIFDTGEMVPRDTPEENMRAMIETVKRYNGVLA